MCLCGVQVYRFVSVCSGSVQMCLCGVGVYKCVFVSVCGMGVYKCFFVSVCVEWECTSVCMLEVRWRMYMCVYVWKLE